MKKYYLGLCSGVQGAVAVASIRNEFYGFAVIGLAMALAMFVFAKDETL